MEKVIYNLVFNRKKKLNAEGKALIQVEAYLCGRKRYFSTKVYVRPCQWDNKRRVVKNHPNMNALNAFLQDCVMELEREELEKRRLNGGFTLKDLLAEKTAVTRRDLLNLPLLCSRQVLRQISGVNEYLEWFGEDFGKLNIVGTYNLIYNAALMVNEGIGYAVTLDKLVNVTGSGNLCFRPLKPKLESGLNIVWKKYQVFSSAAELFLERIQEKFAGSNGG